jgi:hypothetical protein
MWHCNHYFKNKTASQCAVGLNFLDVDAVDLVSKQFCFYNDVSSSEFTFKKIIKMPKA